MRPPKNGTISSFGLGLIMALSGCMADAPQVGRGGAFGPKAPPRVIVADDSVVIAAPYGFCVDRSTLREGRDGAFVLLASCAALTRVSDAPSPSPDALLTASVAANPGPGGRDEDRALVLARYFDTDAGRAALARDGRADSVSIEAMFDRDGLFFLHAADRSAGLGAGLRPDYWRAIFDVNGRIVTATVTPFADRPVTPAAAQALLRDFAGRIRRETARLPAPGAVPVTRAAGFAAIFAGQDLPG
ncbi:hypothetical protein EV663_10875 [Rhodovulum bhavnagarense]|uniref:Uncharacterized protein n=1 Tax=Rhodovulum bhavnagarense TaxID=992286 RepID=A0A4V2SW30_9RHOB|nr:hypothetical protein [Rhodovulum bhavnagarense]TCP60716.1 hypothetical protein EV663_10875 [Rhodovulum bhavnagarense]